MIRSRSTLRQGQNALSAAGLLCDFVAGDFAEATAVRAGPTTSWGFPTTAAENSRQSLEGVSPRRPSSAALRDAPRPVFGNRSADSSSIVHALPETNASTDRLGENSRQVGHSQQQWNSAKAPLNRVLC